MSLLSVEGFALTFLQYASGLRRRRLEVISGLDLDVDAGELVAVVGASGSGKSLLAHALLGLLPSNAIETGRITYDGSPLDAARRRALRGREIALIPQSVTYLDPLATVGTQARRSAELAGTADPVDAARVAFRRLDLADDVAGRYPHELSGGMARRVLTATATIGTPRLVVADEPTPGLHPAMVTETLQGLRRMAEAGAAVVLITHDLLAALTVADRVAVFYAGSTVEVAPTASFAGDGAALHHPYTRALWHALPAHGFLPLAGAQPPPTDLPPGCLFTDRCPLVIPDCRRARPATRQVGPSLVRCIRAEARDA